MELNSKLEISGSNEQLAVTLFSNALDLGSESGKRMTWTESNVSRISWRGSDPLLQLTSTISVDW
jgi:hypothetical protein